MAGSETEVALSAWCKRLAAQHDCLATLVNEMVLSCSLAKVPLPDSLVSGTAPAVAAHEMHKQDQRGIARAMPWTRGETHNVGACAAINRPSHV